MTPLLDAIRNSGLIGQYQPRPSHGDGKHDLERLVRAELRRARRATSRTAPTPVRSTTPLAPKGKYAFVLNRITPGAISPRVQALSARARTNRQ